MKLPKPIKKIVNFAIDSPQHKLAIQGMLIEFGNVVAQGINYKNPTYWKRVSKKIPFFGGGITFNEDKLQRNYNETIEYLSNEKQLTEEHIFFIRDFVIPLASEYINKKE